MNKFLFVLICVIGVFGSAFCSEAQGSSQEISIDVDVVKSGFNIDIKITNKSDQSIKLYKSELPWENRNSMILVAVKARGFHEILNRTAPIDDPGPATLTLKPGETLSGRIDLLSRFPNLADVKSEVVLFWSYQMETMDERYSDRKSGYLTVGANP